MNLIKSTGTFGFYTIISRILGYLRDILIAVFLGTSFLADAFFVAFRIPNTFRRLFAEGTFNAAFVPSYTSELTKGKSKSNNFANEVFTLPEAEVTKAREILKAMKSAQESGAGAATLNGKLIDAASVRQAEQIITQTELIESQS